MEIRRARELKPTIERPGMISVTNIRELKLLCCIDRTKWPSLLSCTDWRRNAIIYIDQIEQVLHQIAAHDIDAVVIDVTECPPDDTVALQTISERIKQPVILIGQEVSRDWLKHLFEMGVSDFIPAEEVTARHVQRIVSYAVIRKQEHAKAHEFAARHQGIVQNATEGIFQTTAEGRYILANPSLATLYGFECPEDLMGNLTDIAGQLYIDPGRRTDFSRIMAKEDRVHNFESEIRRKDGSTIWISENARAVRDGNGEILYYEGFVRNITNRKTNEEKLHYLAQRDILTGLLNRSLFLDELEKAVDVARMTNEKVATLFIDLDNFKRVNDTMGHAIGDRVLQMTADRLMSDTSSIDCVARMSGDEFTVSLVGISDPEGVARVADRIVKSLNDPMMIDGKQIFMSASIGVAVYPDDGDDISDLLKKADTAAYLAKSKGKNSFQFYTESLGAKINRRMDIENGLRHAIERDELELHYQAKVDLDNQKIMGAEALLRWHSEELGFVSPDEFIPIAEENGAILEIGEWVLTEACRQVREWLDKGLAPGVIAVNLSGRQFHQRALFEMISDTLDRYDLPPEQLELELTESAFVEHMIEAKSVLEQVNQLGTRVSIDDFGTGYSSLAYLKRFPISMVKVDRSFVMDIPNDKDNIAIIRAIISLADSLGLKVVAEGIETESQSSYLQALGCDYGQGYYYSKPVVAAEFQELLGYVPRT